jgi:hypothetical protein
MNKKNNNAGDIQKRIIEYAIAWADAEDEGNSKKANRINSKINRIVAVFEQNKDQGIEILVPLLSHNDPTVRLFASVHALDQGIEIKKAENNLNLIAHDSTVPATSVMAYINLDIWRKKNLGNC